MTIVEQCESLCRQWHEEERPSFVVDYPNLAETYDGPYYNKKVVEKTKYICLDRGTSGVFIVDKATGEVFRIKAYGVVNRKKLVGHIDTLTGTELFQKSRW